MRTNQFEVSTQLEGLEEKFRVLNRDDLADELYSRMRLLGGYQQKWIPDVLDLLLHLSDNPVHKSKVEDLQGLRQAPPSPPRLKWVDIDREDPFDRDDPIWRDTVFTGYSSEEEDAPAGPESLGDSGEESNWPVLATDRYPLESIHRGEGEDLVRSLKDTQFWNKSGRDFIIISEADIVKETLLVLLGLPSSIYWRVGNVIELDKRFILGHASSDALRDVEQCVSDLVHQVDSVRAFVGQPQTVEYVQTLQDGVSEHLQRFDQELSGMQSDILTGNLSGSLTVLNLLQKIKDAADSVLHLAMLVQDARFQEPVQTLERLFDLTCEDQALGNSEWFTLLSTLFANTFKRFLASLQKSLDEGRRKDGAGLSLPEFLRDSSPALRKIAKTRLALEEVTAFRSPPQQMPNFEGISTDLESFKGAIKRIYSRYLDSQLATLSTLVKAEIGSRVTQNLKILEYIYLARDISITEALDRIIFRRILKHGGTWNDRFAFADRVRGVYAKVPHIEIYSLSVRPVTRSQGRITKHGDSALDLVGKMSVVYGLRPPVSTIIPREALTRYQDAARMLLQLRWAKKCLEQISYDDDRPPSYILASIRHLSLFAVNTVYDHITSYTIEALSMRMFEAMDDALDIDDVTHAHESFLAELEDQLLLSERLSPLKDALLNLLSLCGELSDLVSPSKTAGPRDQLDIDEETSSDISSDSNETHATVRRGAKSVSGPAIADQLGDIKARFDKHMLFLVAGLKSAGRVQNSGWDILAGKLDWKTAQQRSRYDY